MQTQILKIFTLNSIEESFSIYENILAMHLNQTSYLSTYKLYKSSLPGISLQKLLSL